MRHARDRRWRGRHRARNAAALLASLVIAMIAARGAFGAEDTATLLERRVKAALIYRLTNYVEWPDAAFSGPATPFHIEIAGADALAAELAEFAADRRVLNRPLVVRRRGAGADPGREAQLLFVGREESSQLPGIVRSAPPNALIVTESEHALRMGSVVNFIIVDGQVRFEISLEAAQRRNLRLSSRLLSVAHAVHGGAP